MTDFFSACAGRTDVQIAAVIVDDGDKLHLKVSTEDGFAIESRVISALCDALNNGRALPRTACEGWPPTWLFVTIPNTPVSKRSLWDALKKCLPGKVCQGPHGLFSVPVATP